MKINANLPCLSALLAAALLMSGCASQQYMGVSLKPGGADPAVQALAAKAQGGDKQAQYELGRWFEDSTDADGLKKAKRLYRQAASDSGGSRLLLVPSSSGLTTSVVGMGPKIDGNEAAQARLQQLTLAQKIKQNHIRSGIGGMANHATESKGINMISNLNKLANIPAGKIKVTDVSEILGVELKLLGSSDIHMEDVYTNDFDNENLEVMLFVLYKNPYGLNIRGSNIKNKKLEKIKHFLFKNGWTHKTEIKHPFKFHYFYKKNKRISLQYNMLDLLNIGMSGLSLDVNVEGDDVASREMEQDHIQSGFGGMANHTTENKDISMIGNLNKLSNIPAGTMKASDVAEIFGIELTKTKSDEFGDIYNSDLTNNDLKIELSKLPTNEFRLRLSGLKIQTKKLEKSKDFLIKNNWGHGPIIRYPFIVDVFHKKNKKISINHTMLNLSTISISGLNVDGGE